MILWRVYVINYILILCWWDVMRTRWWLHSATGSYGQSVLEAIYGETIIHSIVWEILAREEWLGCRHDTSPMVDIPGSILVWAQYIVFSDFNKYKNLYVICFENLYVLWKKHWWSLTLSWPNDVQRTFSTSHNIFLMKNKSIDISLFHLNNWFYTCFIFC